MLLFSPNFFCLKTNCFSENMLFMLIVIHFKSELVNIFKFLSLNTININRSTEARALLGFNNLRG